MKKFIAVDNGSHSGIQTKDDALSWARRRLTIETKPNAKKQVFICEVIEEAVVETPPVKVVPFNPKTLDPMPV